MRWPYKFEKCILCLKDPPGNWEHIIPDSIGGNLQARLLCISCNSISGSKFIGNLTQSDSIRLAMEYLKNELPNLYSRLMDKATYIGNATDGSLVRISKSQKRGQRVLHSSGADGSRILDTKEADDVLAKLLAKNKVSLDQVDTLKKAFVDLEEDIPLEIPGGYKFLKHPIPKLRPELKPEKKIDDRLPALIAFEFLAILCGNQILNEGFDPVREYICNGTPTNRVIVEQFIGGKKYDTAHAIIFEPIDSTIRVTIRLFRWITYVVTFTNVNFQRQRCIYFQDLKSNESIFNEL
jgi:hypothetical protein